MTAGELLRETRERRGVPQRALAVRAGASQGYISQVERGLISPTLEGIERLFAALGEELVYATAPPAPIGDAESAEASFDPGPALAALAARDVALVVVGTLAARILGYAAAADALEVTVDPEPRNQERLTRALGDLGARIAKIVPGPQGQRALAEGATFRFDSGYGPLVLTPNGTRWLSLARRSTITKLGGVAVPCAGRDDLIARARPGGVSPDPALLARLTRGPGAGAPEPGPEPAGLGA